MNILCLRLSHVVFIACGISIYLYVVPDSEISVHLYCMCY